MLIIDSGACSGCLLCVTSCSLQRTRSCGYEAALMRVERDERASAFFVRHCAGCTVRACLDACTEGALSVDPALGTLQVEAARCISCEACVARCPHGLLRMETTGPLACDLCGGAPACARVCATGALQWTNAPPSQRSATQ